MKPSRSEKLAVFAELFVKLHILSSAQKDEIINVNKETKKPLTRLQMSKVQRFFNAPFLL